MEKETLRGGEYLTKQTNSQDIFIPEEFDEEQLMIAQSCKDFLKADVFPVLDKIDKLEEGLLPDLLKKSGELGLTAVPIPEKYDGFGQSFVTSMLASDIMGSGGSFSVAYSAHTGIGTLPIMYYGNEQQKQKYLPKLASAEWLGAYCLTEPGAGSDANAGTTKAVLSEDGKHYILNGQKMWITNAGFADIFTVFAKIDNDRILSAFIVEKDYPGFSLNPEENKMGIKGSSTRQIFLNDCKVPVENLLGKRGEGFRIALNILNLGRIKLGANVIGSAKKAITLSVNYANERKQFRTLISSFGAIKYKLSEQVIRTFANESAVYRASQNVEDAVKMYVAEGMDNGKAQVEAQRKFVIEAALLKVYGSEMLDYVVDEGVQIHGGMGFSAETEIETFYRDSRINRIFEGTNEINRMVISDTMIKKGTKKEIALIPAAEKVMQEIENLHGYPVFDENGNKRNQQIIENLRNATLLITKIAIDKLGKKISREQQILFNLADMMTQLYMAESTSLRVEKAENLIEKERFGLFKDMLNIFLYESSQIIYKAGLDALFSFDIGKEYFKYCKAITYYTKVKPFDLKAARIRIADKLIADNRFNFTY